LASTCISKAKITRAFGLMVRNKERVATNGLMDECKRGSLVMFH
jgi:hypothetical protein